MSTKKGSVEVVSGKEEDASHYAGYFRNCDSKSATRMTVSVQHASSAHLRNLDAKAQVWLGENIPEFKTVGSGLSVIFAHLSERNINSMLFRSFMALVIISMIFPLEACVCY